MAADAYQLEDGSGVILLESGDRLILEPQPQLVTVGTASLTLGEKNPVIDLNRVVASYPTSVSVVVVGNQVWNQPSQALILNQAYTSTTLGAEEVSDTIEFSDFGFDGLVPEGATITAVRLGSYGYGDVTEFRIRARVGGVDEELHTSPFSLSSDPALDWVSATSDRSWTRSDLLNANFKVRFQVFSSVAEKVALLDQVLVEVTYTVAGNVTSTPATAALTTTSFAPTASAPRLVTPAVASLATATFAPTVVAPRLATPGTKALATTSFAPVVLAPRLVTPTTASLVTALFAPAVLLPKLATPAFAALTTASFAPTVSATANQRAVPATAALATTPFAPSVLAPRLVTPSTNALSITSFAPVVLAPRLVTPPTKALTTASFAPSALAPRLVTPAMVALATSLFSPIVSFTDHKRAVPSTAALATETFAPAVQAGQGTTVVPSVASLATMRFAPTVSTPRLSTPGTAAMSLTRFAPSVLAPRLVTIGAAALSLTRFAPRIDLVVVVQQLALTLTRFAASVLAPRVVTPPNVALTTTPFAPSVVVPVTPGTRALTTTKFEPDVDATANVWATPGTKALATSAFPPTAQTPSMVVPTTKSLTTTRFAPSALTPKLVVPATASLLLALFAPTVTATRWIQQQLAMRFRSVVMGVRPRRKSAMTMREEVDPVLRRRRVAPQVRNKRNITLRTVGPQEMVFKAGTSIEFEATFTDADGALYDPVLNTIKLFLKQPDNTYKTGYVPGVSGAAMAKISLGVYRVTWQSSRSDQLGIWTAEAEGTLGGETALDDIKFQLKA
jgi:hypothetical protein